MKIFVDSSILIEYVKGNQIDFYETLIEQNHDLYINQVVHSEFLFHFIGLSANKSPLSVKESGKIAESFGKRNPLEMLPNINICYHTRDVAQTAFEMMKRYNLLPNDALILASCEDNQIEYLASFDSDFNIPCQALGIKIFNDPDDLRSFIPRIKLTP